MGKDVSASPSTKYTAQPVLIVGSADADGNVTPGYTAGTVTMSGSPVVQIGNTPSVTLAGSPVVTAVISSIVLSGSPTVLVGSLPAVSVSGSPTVLVGSIPAVGISGSPTVLVGSLPAVSVSGSPTVLVGNAVSISGSPTVKVGSMPAVSLSGSPTVLVGSIPDVGISGSPTVLIGSIPNIDIDSMPDVTISGSPTVLIGSIPDVGISGSPTVIVGNSVDVNSLPSISGTVGISGSPVVIVAGITPSGFAGRVSSVTFGRPGNTTPYVAGENVGVDKTISGVSEDTPIEITTVEDHLLVDGDPVTITGVTGDADPGANGIFFAKRTGSKTFTLYTDKALTEPAPSTGSYSGAGDVARLFCLHDFFPATNGAGYVKKIRMMTDNPAWADQFLVRFYSWAIYAYKDQDARALLWSNLASELGSCKLSAFAAGGAGSTAAAAIATPLDGISNLPLYVYNADGSQDLYFTLEDLGTGTPITDQQFYLEATFDTQ